MKRTGVWVMLLLWLVCQTTMGQAVIFPQEEQLGVAKVVKKKGVYTLSNRLFSAKFEQKDGKVYFAGSKELGLMPETEIFKLRLGDGKEVKASEMKLENLQVVELKGDAKAVKGNTVTGVVVTVDRTDSEKDYNSSKPTNAGAIVGSYLGNSSS